MIVGRDRWDGDVRHIEQVTELRGVAVVSAPAYPSAGAELRHREEEPSMSTAVETRTASPAEDPPEPTRGSLRVENRHGGSQRPIETRIVVFAPSAAAVVRRRDATLDVDRTGAYFQNDSAGVRMCARLDLVVGRPTGVVKITGLPAAAPSEASAARTKRSS
jgi:hypothetical protein